MHLLILILVNWAENKSVGNIASFKPNVSYGSISNESLMSYYFFYFEHDAHAPIFSIDRKLKL